jgi:hypothetical protein
MKRRRLNIFSLSFLDCISCGLGAVILLFVIVNAKSAVQRDTVTTELRAEVDRLEMQVLGGKKDLVAARNSLEQTEAQLVKTSGLARRIRQTLEERQVELADSEKDTLARQAHINRLKADLKSVEEELRRLKAAALEAEKEGQRLREFPGRGDRQYLTDMKMGGQRIFILVDASASMLDETIVGAIRRRNLDNRQKLAAPKWRRAVATIEWLTAMLPPDSRFQIYSFNETAGPLIAGTEGSWLSAGDVHRLDQAVEQMRRLVPQKGTSLISAFEAAAGMQPPPDNLFLLADSLPTMGKSKPWGRRVSSRKRFQLFEEAARQLPPRVPVNVILYPMEGDPLAAGAYWSLAKNSQGSFLCPSEDWP